MGVRTPKGEVNVRRFGVPLEGVIDADFAPRGIARVLAKLRFRTDEKRFLRLGAATEASDGRGFSDVSSGDVGGVREVSVEVRSRVGFSIEAYAEAVMRHLGSVLET